MKDLWQVEKVLWDYRSPFTEVSISKDIPMKFLPLIKAAYPGAFRYRYRGKSKGWYTRDPSYCLEQMAETFAIYKRKL